jgi:hypothetical protein
MTVIGNRFTPAFAGRRPDGPTPAPPGPDIRFAVVTETAGRVNVTLQIGPDAPPIATIDMDWGDGTRQALGGLVAAHAYTDGGVFELRAIARSDAGRTSVNSIRVQVLEGASPIPDPVADFTIAPAAPTSADLMVLDAAPSTPAEYIEAYEWGQQMPVTIPPAEGPQVMNLGAQPPGAYVWNLRVRLTDGRWSVLRSRGVNIVATEDPGDEPDPEPEPEA